MSRFNRVMLAAILGLGLGIAVLSVALARLGPTVSSMSTASTIDGASVNTQLALSFSEPMRIQSVERSFQVRPRVAGDFSWSGNQMLFLPRRPLRYGQRYTVTVTQGALSQSGKSLAHVFRDSFTTQNEHLLYLGTSGSERGHLMLASLDGQRRSVGVGDGLITGYSVSLDRTLAVYVKRGRSGERPDQIWLLNLTDNSTQRVFGRPDWSMTEPHLSPDNRYIVFLATNVRICPRYYNCYRDRSSPLVYLYDLSAHRLFPYRSTSDVPITDFIDFSPHGQLAYTDLGSALTLANPNGQGVIHIPNSNNALSYAGFDAPGDKAAFVGQTPSSSGGDILVYGHGQYTDISRGVYDSSTPSFSTAGTRAAFAAYHGERGIEPLYGIDVYNFKTGTRRLLTHEGQWTDWAPEWSLDDAYIAFVRTQPAEAMYLGSGEVWVMRADGSEARPLGGIGRDISWVS